jgi:hypothetical protein
MKGLYRLAVDDKDLKRSLVKSDHPNMTEIVALMAAVPERVGEKNYSN